MQIEIIVAFDIRSLILFALRDIIIVGLLKGVSHGIHVGKRCFRKMGYF